MLNQKQRIWIIGKCSAMLEAAKDFNLTENDFEIILEMINKYVNQAKGNEQVKQALIETETYIEHMYKILGR